MRTVLNDRAAARPDSIRFGGRARASSAPRSASRRGVRAAPARHLRDRHHDRGRADVPVPRRAPDLPAGRAARPAPGRDARRRGRRPTTDSATGSCTSRRSSSATRSAAERCRSSPIPCRRRRRPRASSRSCSADIDDPISDLGGRRDRPPRSPTRSRAARAAGADAAGADRPRGASAASASTSPSTRPSRRRRGRWNGSPGLDRYTIARHFRRAFGTSPDRYRTMRRLDAGADGDRERRSRWHGPPPTPGSPTRAT